MQHFPHKIHNSKTTEPGALLFLYRSHIRTSAEVNEPYVCLRISSTILIQHLLLLFDLGCEFEAVLKFNRAKRDLKVNIHAQPRPQLGGVFHVSYLKAMNHATRSIHVLRRGERVARSFIRAGVMQTRNVNA